MNPSGNEHDNMQEVFEQARQRALDEFHHLPWYQQHPDIAVPLFIFVMGLFQFVLRKWILPVSKDIIFELEDQFPTQGLFYHPGLGVFLMIVGVILLVVFNIGKFF